MSDNCSISGAELIARLSGLGEMRVWSVIITIFGDAVVPRGGDISASALGAMTEPLGIRPEALRVALHRLVKDGWIARDRTGRKAFYTLSDIGKAEFLPATQRIYATGPALVGPWTLNVLPPIAENGHNDLAVEMAERGFQELVPNLYLGHAASDVPVASALTTELQPEQLPDWARSRLAPKELQDDYLSLFEAIKGTLAAKPDGSTAAACRVLLVHQWRRVLLRHADLPPELLPKDWLGEHCRSAFLNLHDTLSAAADPWLDEKVVTKGKVA